MNKEFILQMTKTLESEKKSLLIQASVKHDIDTDGDEMDEIQGNVLIELNSQLANRINKNLSLIDAALQRIKDKKYGICDDCEEDISDKRLLANPYFETCISCAEQREMSSKKRS